MENLDDNGEEKKNNQNENNNNNIEKNDSNVKSSKKKIKKGFDPLQILKNEYDAEKKIEEKLMINNFNIILIYIFNFKLN